MKHMANKKDNSIEKMESLANKYEAVQGDIEKLIIAQKEIVIIGDDLENKILQVVKERDLVWPQADYSLLSDSNIYK